MYMGTYILVQARHFLVCVYVKLVVCVCQPPPGPPPMSNGLAHGAAAETAGPSHQEPPPAPPDASASAQPAPAASPPAAEEPLPSGWEMRYDVYGRRSVYIQFVISIIVAFDSIVFFIILRFVQCQFLIELGWSWCIT